MASAGIEEAKHIEIQSFLGWITNHPHWALAVIFLVALTESLVVVGLIMPGAALMIAAGVLIALGTLDFWPTLFASVVGAIAGYGISYWIGHHYRVQLRTVWLFNRHPEWLSRGESFFLRHGGKSVLFGRFIGLVRPIIPLVAGMLGMRPAVFYTMNVLSALAWASAHLLPGMAFGASLALAGEVAARLAVFLLLLGTLAWCLWWFVRWSFLVLFLRAAQMAERFLAWAGSHPQLSRIMDGVLDPSRPKIKTLVLIGAFLIGAAMLFFAVLQDVFSGDPLVHVDHGLYQLAQGLRTPWSDKCMVFVTELGDGIVISLVAVAVLAWLVWRKSWRAAGYWAAALGFGQIASTIFNLVLQRPRPLADLYDGLSANAFPTGHATMSMVVYGFLSVLIAAQFSRPRRWLVYAVSALLIFAVSASRLYLGVLWLSEVIGGLGLGLAWVCLLAIAYHRHPVPPRPEQGLPGVALLVLALAGGWHVSAQYSADLLRYTPRQIVQHFDAAAWWQTDWRRLPAYRIDLEGKFEQPLNVQWTGKLGDIRKTLGAQGWREPAPFEARSALRWLAPAATLAELPLTPQIHDGNEEVLRMICPLPTTQRGSRQLVLRFWKSGVILGTIGDPLWVGSISFQKLGHIALLTLPVGDQKYDEALSILMDLLRTTGLGFVQQSRTAKEISSTAWTGDVLLIRGP